MRNALVHGVLQLAVREHLTRLLNSSSSDHLNSIAILVSLHNQHRPSEWLDTIAANVGPPLRRLSLVPATFEELDAFSRTEQLSSYRPTRLDLKHQSRPRDPGISQPFRQREIVSDAIEALSYSGDSRTGLACILPGDSC